MALLRAASQEYNWNLDLGEIARIWKGGCIIRAAFLDKIKQAYEREPNLANLLLDRDFAEAIMGRQSRWRMIVQTAARMGIPVPAFAASLAYFDSYRRDRLPANLIQAQRDSLAPTPTSAWTSRGYSTRSGEPLHLYGTVLGTLPFLLFRDRAGRSPMAQVSTKAAVIPATSSGRGDLRSFRRQAWPGIRPMSSPTSSWTPISAASIPTASTWPISMPAG